VPNQREEFLGCCRAMAFQSGGPNLRATLLGKKTKYAPDRAVDTLHVSLDLDLDFKKRTLSGTCETTVRPFRAGVKEISFDAIDLQVSKVTVDGKPVRHELKDEKLTIRLGKALEEGRSVKVLVRYRAVDPKSGLHFVYPGKHNPKNPVQVWSQSQPEDARYWYPCHDNPHQKCTNEVRCAVPRGFKLVSNGVLISQGSRGAKDVFHWKMDQPHSIYLISIAAGRFAEIVEEWDGIPVTYYCEKGREEDAKRGFAKTKKVLEYFSQLVCRYPYPKYAQVAVAEYPGGMEHTTCTTQTDAILIDKRAALDNDLDLLVAHEAAHQWFGDLLTCREWSHGWLNEGFATYFEILFNTHDKGVDEGDHELAGNAHAYFDEDGKRYRRPIVCETYKLPWTIFDRHLYEKGGWVLHMLRHEVGEDLFWKSIRHYVQKHANSSVDTDDLVAAFRETTGRNLRWFFDQWVYKQGYPSLRAQATWDPKTKKAEIWLLQTQDTNEDNPLFDLKLDIRITGRGWTKEFTERAKDKEHHFSYALPGEPLDIELDPNHCVLKRLAFNKPQKMWRHQLLNAQRAVSRGEAAARVARWGDDAAVALLARAIRQEKFWGAACDMVRALGNIKSETAFRELSRLIKIRHPKVRRAVVDALGGWSRPEVARLVAPLAKKDPSVLVESTACRVLGATKDPKYKGLLLEASRRKSYRDVVAAGAIGGLSATRDPKHLDFLLKSSRQPNSFTVRVQALRSLAEYAPISDKVVPAICEQTDDQDERFNLAAIAILGQMEDERALPTLEKLKKDPNSRLRSYAEESIARIRSGIEGKAKKK
jgi:aminopeptidase N